MIRIFQNGFERARDLSFIGLDDFARQELYEVERRTRSANDRRTLMSEYQVVQSYHRSSYLGDVTFGMQRVRAGLKKRSRTLGVCLSKSVR